MAEVDSEKFHRLLLDWLEHEHWIQNGCPDAASHQLRVPGYSVVAQQDVRAYDHYRHSFPPYFAVAKGFIDVHEDLMQMFKDTTRAHPDVMRRLMAAYQEPGEKFRAQWENLFDIVFHDGLTHQSLLQYQRKYEVELPLCFLANLREVASKGTLDLDLSRFRDAGGKLKKGVMAQYVKDGIRRYPSLRAIVEQAFHTGLRNAVGHNAYRLRDGVVSGLDGSFSLTEEQFIRILEALQVLQNLVLWLFLSIQEDYSSLESRGILAIGWGILEGTDEPHLTVFQLAPFHALDERVQWLNEAVLERNSDQLGTRLNSAPPILGPIPGELESILERIRSSGLLAFSVVPVMPCIHTHDAHTLPQGAFCQVAPDVTGLVNIQFSS